MKKEKTIAVTLQVDAEQFSKILVPYIDLPEKEEKTYWTIKEFSEYANVHQRTTFRWLKNGKIPKEKIHGRVLIPIAQTKELIKKREIHKRNLWS